MSDLLWEATTPDAQVPEDMCEAERRLPQMYSWAKGAASNQGPKDSERWFDLLQSHKKKLDGGTAPTGKLSPPDSYIKM